MNEQSNFNINATQCCVPDLEDDIVISGISGRYPNSHNIEEFAFNLYNKIDMVDEREVRYKHRINIPKRYGKIYDIDKFDAAFFGCHNKLADAMHPHMRLLLEHAFEAVLDAGINPADLAGTNTGVFSAVCELESSAKMSCSDSDNPYTLVGENRAMLANRISYLFDLKGPSYAVDSACSSAMMAIQCAYNSMRSGECDACIVTGSNLTLIPLVTLQFAKLGVLAPDGFSRSFDEKATGYTRSEAIVVIILQKRKSAKRCYASLVHSKINCDGFKSEGITFPSALTQQQLLDSFYKEINVKPNIIDYIEAHATGIAIGDPEECKAIDQVFCQDRDEPLLVGSVKSNMGHSEPASGLCSISKCILTFETGKIPPNIHFETPKKDISALHNGHIKVVDNVMNLPGPLIACNSYGFGGANGHVLLKKNEKLKINHGIPEDGLPRLVFWSGRTDTSCDLIFDEICKRPLDAELIGVIHSSQSKQIKNNTYRGYGVFKQGEENAVCIGRGTIEQPTERPPLVWVFSGMGAQYVQMGASLMSLPIFKRTIEECHLILKANGIDLIHILTSPNVEIIGNTLNSFLGIVAVQIGIVNILRYLGIEADYIIGHSAGEICCGYADGCLSLEETILTAYSRGMACIETDIIHGAMAAIGMGYEQIEPMLPDGIEAACHNGFNSCTISGPSDLVRAFVENLQNKGVFVKEIPCGNIPYHSRYIKDVGPKLEAKLKKIIRKPKLRSSKWLSSSVPFDKWGQQENTLCSSKYQANNLLNPVLFEETMKHLPVNALTIEVSPHALLQAIVKSNMTKANHISLCHKYHLSNLELLLQGLGKLYTYGFDMSIEKLYPEVKFPVSVGTPMLSPCIGKGWDHKDKWSVLNFDEKGLQKNGTHVLQVQLSSDEYGCVAGHKIGGKIVFPGTGYVYLAWKAFGLALDEDVNYDEIPVVLSDIKFLRATILTLNSVVLFNVMIQKGSGSFEITESGTSVCTGVIKRVYNNNHNFSILPKSESNAVLLKTKDFYRELFVKGYNFEGDFQAVLEVKSDGSQGKIKWTGNIIPFLDGMLQVDGINYDSRVSSGITGLVSVKIDPKSFAQAIKTNEEGIQYVDVRDSRKLGVIQVQGIEILFNVASIVTMSMAPIRAPTIESYKFIPYFNIKDLTTEEGIRVLIQLWLENAPSFEPKIVEISSDDEEPLITYVQKAIDEIPIISPDMILVTNKKDVDLPDVGVEIQTVLPNKMNFSLIITSLACMDIDQLTSFSGSSKDEPFVILKEKPNINASQIGLTSNFQLISVIKTVDYTLFLLIYQIPKAIEPVNVVRISEKDESFKWLNKLKEKLKVGKVYLVSQNETFNGILGLVNCLKREPSSGNVSCLFIDPSAPTFDPELPFYKEQLKKNLAINVYINGEWGSYRHLLLKTSAITKPQTKHCFANTLIKGDISSLQWFEGSLRSDDSDLIAIHYSALNFKDVMMASGRLDLTAMYPRLLQDCIIGFEYSGLTSDGKRVMGIAIQKAISNFVKPIEFFTWNVPTSWSLEQAATIPVVYSTVYLAFFISTRIKRGKKILIHAGSGGVGLAAIQVAFAYGLEVFTTVSTTEKKQFLLQKFPLLKESNIGNSRDTSFYSMVMEETDGVGVDYVLNSLSEEKLIVSLQCLAPRGHFLEIGKYDILANNKVGLIHFWKNITFHAVMLDRDIGKRDSSELKELHDIVQRDLDNGIIIPLPTTVFPTNEAKQAFRYLAASKHIGKVLIQVRESLSSKATIPISVTPRCYCKPELSYVLLGGLGGFGVELVDWLILRGARKIILSSRTGVKLPYQQFRINLWKSYDAHIEICTADITSYKGCRKLLQTAENLGAVGGIFNLAAILNDKIFENQTVEAFTETMSVKASATKFLDEISRSHCPKLEMFVVFSSLSCGRGNPGQTNYGMANSVMERIVEDRKAAGFPGKAIQWGAIGDVGLAVELNNDKEEVGGTIKQRIASCLKLLDELLTSPDPIVSSMVVAKKKKRNMHGGIMGYLKSAFNIRNNSPAFLKQTLFEIGVDSLMTVEVLQVLERDYELSLPLESLRTLTLQDIVNQIQNTSDQEIAETNATLPEFQLVDLFFAKIKQLSDETLLKLKTRRDDSTGIKILIPGIYGVCNQVLYELGEKLDSKAFCLQFEKYGGCKNINEIASSVIDEVKEKVMVNTDRFCLIGHSYGGLIALDLAAQLEERGYYGKVVMIDASPAVVRKRASATFEIRSKTNYNKQSEHGVLNRVKTCLEVQVDDFKKLKSDILVLAGGADKDSDFDVSMHSSGFVKTIYIKGDHHTMLKGNGIEDMANVINAFDADDINGNITMEDEFILS